MAPSSDERASRRRILGLTAAALAGLGGCQGSGVESSQTVTPARVPADALTADTLVFRHGRDGSPTAAAIEQLVDAFETASEGTDVVEAPLSSTPDERRTASVGSAVVTYDRIGATLAARSPSLEDLSSVRDGWRERYPHGLVVSSFVDGTVATVPQTAHRLNCIYYNPEVLSTAGVTIDDYATVSDLRESPGSLADVVETLFAQPLRSETDLLELWETLLASRLYREQQYVEYVAGAIDGEPPTIRQSIRDLDAALSLLPTGVEETTPAALLDGVVDGSVGFVRQPTWASRHLIARSDATYGVDWAVAPLFAGEWIVSFVAEGFAVPRERGSALTAWEFVRFATEAEQQRAFCETASAIPARTDVSVDGHPLLVDQAKRYANASMHLPSIAHGIAVRSAIRRRLEDALWAFRDHRRHDEVLRAIVAAMSDADPL